MSTRKLMMACVLLLLATRASAADPATMHDAHAMPMGGALGAYPMTREASGSSWQPDHEPMHGVHGQLGAWSVMTHGYADLVYDDQGGRRGDEKTFVPSMLMVMGQRALGPGTWGLRSMVSLDPLMGREGYPLLFQTGETADGETELVDRQHPHDFFMELATSYSVPVGRGSMFVYLGLPGEPALGPSAFMHRGSGVHIPEAPLSHHWLDSTHITFGVATLGAVYGPWKIDASAFNGREPDPARWNIETRGFDSYSGRLSWNPTSAWSAQISHGYLASPEQLEPEIGVHRSTASIAHVRQMTDGHWSTTLAVGVNREHGSSQPAYAVESTRAFGGAWSVFGRAEYLRNDHLIDEVPLARREFRIGKLSLGAAYKLGQYGPLAFRVGALASAYRVPDALDHAYGSTPLSAMVFLRTSIE